MGSGGDGPLGGMAGMEPHHMNGSLGTVTSSLYCTHHISTESLVTVLNLSSHFKEDEHSFDLFYSSQAQVIWTVSPR